MLKKMICCMLVLALAMGCALAEGAMLTVQGAGSVTLRADTATIMLGVRKYATDVKEAQQAVNRSMDAVIEALAGAGVAREDMYTSSISIYPEYNYDAANDDENARIKGYTASNSLTIVTEDIESVGAYIDAAFDAGANTLDDVGFRAADTVEASHQALRLAIESAQAKAQVMAEAAGMELGELVSVQEGDSNTYGAAVPYARNGMATEAASDKTQVFAAKQEVTATVTLQYALREK